jgi:ligand-binding SRPBCC domain-containing protein
VKRKGAILSLQTIISEILIAKDIEVVFDLALSIEAHLAAEKHTSERAVGERTAGLLDLGDTITFEAVHLMVRQRLTSKVVEMDRPHRFVDEMQRGAFKSLRHEHVFLPVSGGTLMRDRIEFEAPLGFAGRIAERLFLRRYMLRFLKRHQDEFRKIAEEGPIDG